MSMGIQNGGRPTPIGLSACEIGASSAPQENGKIIEGKIIPGAAEPIPPWTGMILPSMILPLALAVGRLRTASQS